MASAIAQAVEAAKKRLQQQQKPSTSSTASRRGGGGKDAEREKVRSSRKRDKALEDEDVDMEMSAESSASGDENDDDDSEDEEKVDKKDKIYFHHAQNGIGGKAGSGITPRGWLPRGQAPAAAIAWQASKKVLEEKLSLNGKKYLMIERAEFQRTRKGQEGKMAVPNGEELEKHFNAFGIDRVSLSTRVVRAMSRRE